MCAPDKCTGRRLLAFQSPAQAQVPPGGRTPKVLSLLPASVVAGQISGLLRVSITGTGFGPYMTARVSYAASLNSATIVSADVQVQHDGSTQATLTLSPAMLAHPQQLTIVLTDPASGGNTSLVFTVAAPPNPVPSVVSIQNTNYSSSGYQNTNVGYVPVNDNNGLLTVQRTHRRG
jgi:hypothetical protein